MKSKAKARALDVRSLVIVSDLHCGCRMGLWPCDADLTLDGGVGYKPSQTQHAIWAWWREFWDAWVPMATRGEPYAVAVNGDAIDGRHHGATHQVSQNLADQGKVARAVLEPVRDLCDGRLIIIAGTEAHVGPSAEIESALARELGALPCALGNVWPDAWLDIGGALVHCAHHIGCTGATHYESSAPHRELAEAFTEAARWGEKAPRFVVRSHRHRYISTEIYGEAGLCRAIVTSGWQAKTPFAYRVAGGRQSPPQFGGVVIRSGDEEAYARPWVRSVRRVAPTRFGGVSG